MLMGRQKGSRQAPKTSPEYYGMLFEKDATLEDTFMHLNVSSENKTDITSKADRGRM